jgi:hypothetical protein
VIYAVIGILKQPVPPLDGLFQAEFNEHLAQPAVRVVNSGYLRDEQGEPIGLLGLLDVETFAQAKAYLEASPFYTRGLYEHAQVACYDVDVGRVG